MIFKLSKFILCVMLISALNRANLQAQYIPDPPYNLGGYVFYTDAVYLYWYYSPGSKTDGFRIFYSILPDTTKTLAKVTGPNQTATFVENLTPGTAYTFYVAAFNVYGQSGFSNPYSIQLPVIITGTPAPPTNLKVINVSNSSITIQWQDNSNNELGFKIAKSTDNDTSFIISDSVPSDVLSYQEIGLTPNTDYFYKVCAYNEFGFSNYTNTVYVRTTESGMNIINQLSTVAEKFYLGNNYPNPFNPSTTIRFGISKRDLVEISIYDAAGKLVEIIFSGDLDMGDYQVTWTPYGLNSGVYFYTMVSGDFRASGKMMLVK